MSTCCFFGHRTIDETEQLKMRLRDCIEKMITELNIDTFLFGSKSRFNDLCLETVTALKEKYPHIGVCATVRNCLKKQLFVG